MKEFVIFSDSTCDLNRQTREEYGIAYLPMNFLIDDIEHVASLDWEEFSYKDYYNLMREGKRVFTTQVPKTLYEEAFRKAVESGKDVLYISCSSALSSSVNTASVVAKELQVQYPDAGIYCVDSLISSLGQGYLVLEAAKKRAEGWDAEKTARHIESIRLCVNQCGTVSSMEYLRRAGRVTASKAFFGNLFGIKPIIISDRKGQNYAIKKAKGIVAARAAIAEHIKDAADGNYEKLMITHADCLEDAELLRDAILAVAPFKKVEMGVIGPIVGSAVGPGTVIAFCFGKEVTVEGEE